MRLVIGSDHAGLPMKDALAAWAKTHGVELLLVGAATAEAYDYPDAANEVADILRNGQADLGVLCCGAGIGMSIAANRHTHIRAALCTNTTMAELARNHNHANVLCLGARLLSAEEGVAILETFLATEPSTERRHIQRVEKLTPRACASDPSP